MVTEDLNKSTYTEVYGENMITTIKIHSETKSDLDQFREYKNESYDEVIKKVVYIAKNCKKKPQLSKETMSAIEEARKRMDRGQFLTKDEAKKRLWL